MHSFAKTMNLESYQIVNQKIHLFCKIKNILNKVYTMRVSYEKSTMRGKFIMYLCNIRVMLLVIIDLDA